MTFMASVILGFQSTPSARRATSAGKVLLRPPGYFNPRPPRGGRRWIIFWPCPFRTYFNPRPPRGGRLSCCRSSATYQPISIHALREEGDRPGCGGGDPDL